MIKIKKIYFLSFIIVALSVCSSALAQVSIPGSLLPADRNADWNPGMNSVGGIPNRTTVCATVSPSGGEDSGRINAAINSCPAGQVVQLTAGTFLTNDHVLVNKGITLRGAGPDQTVLSKTNGATPGSYNPPDAEENIIVGPYRYSNDPDTSVNLTSDAQDGAYSVTVSSTAGFAPGQFVIIDEDHFSNSVASWQPLYFNGAPTGSQVWVSDRVLWKLHNPAEGQDDGFPDSLCWFTRCNGNVLGEVKEIASISGNTVTFTTPFHINYRTNHNAQMTRDGNGYYLTNAGVENLTMLRGSNGCINFHHVAKSWAKNIECDTWLGHGVDIHRAHKIEIRDSTIHDGAWQVPTGGGYAIDVGSYSSDILIENNIIFKTNKVMVANSGGAGSVVAYNYTDDGHAGDALSWQEVGINGSHYAGSHHMLFEGNYSFNADSDSTHGGASYHTFFRNHLSGFVKSYPDAVMRTAGAYAGSWYMSFIGNVLGLPGRMNGFIYEDTQGIGTPAIWKLGLEPTSWDEDPDPKVLSTILRGGNFDYLTNSVRWENVSQQALPNSLYLNSKPFFFGNNTWPWVDPIGNTKLYTLPAKYCYEQGQGPLCLAGGSVPTPPPPPPPTNGVILGDINLDHIVNSLDWSLMSANWLTNNSASDINKDGLVNSLDFSTMSSNWLKTW